MVKCLVQFWTLQFNMYKTYLTCVNIKCPALEENKFMLILKNKTYAKPQHCMIMMMLCWSKTKQGLFQCTTSKPRCTLLMKTVADRAGVGARRGDAVAEECVFGKAAGDH